MKKIRFKKSIFFKNNYFAYYVLDILVLIKSLGSILFRMLTFKPTLGVDIVRLLKMRPLCPG